MTTTLRTLPRGEAPVGTGSLTDAPVPAHVTEILNAMGTKISKKRARSKQVLLQTVVSPHVAKRLKAAALHEGISAAAFVRRLILAWERDAR